jgi:hypothetical protein
MELQYYKHKREDQEYKTWYYASGNVYHNPRYTGHHRLDNGESPLVLVVGDCSDHPSALAEADYGWTKIPMPKGLTKEEELDWMMTSNKEDMHFIMKEREACGEWMLKNLDEIIEAQKNNKEIKKMYQNQKSKRA